jgi:hypothetical protein
LKAKLTSLSVATVVDGLALAGGIPRVSYGGPVAEPNGSETLRGAVDKQRGQGVLRLSARRRLQQDRGRQHERWEVRSGREE